MSSGQSSPDSQTAPLAGDRGKRRQTHASSSSASGPLSGWTRDNLEIVSILIKEKRQLRDAVAQYQAAEERMEKYKNGPIARQRLERLFREVSRTGMQPAHVQQLRDILDEFPEDEAAPLRQKLGQYEMRRLLQINRVHRRSSG
ncbi:hypothetical protein C2E23DRAFT_409716 [Lenzites betulinus]|nr:hypothetical protein C2E23DRAFT_409716 [Lenzites betulinus]